MLHEIILVIAEETSQPSPTGGIEEHRAEQKDDAVDLSEMYTTAEKNLESCAEGGWWKEGSPHVFQRR